MSQIQNVIEVLENEQKKILAFSEETKAQVREWEKDESFKEKQAWLQERNTKERNMLEEYKAKTKAMIGIADGEQTEVLQIYKVIAKAIEYSRD